MYGDVIRNAILEIAEILNRNKTKEIQQDTQETRVIQKTEKMITKKRG